MKHITKPILLLLYLLQCLSGYSQDESKQCLTIDFETINGSPSIEGMVISNQFYAQFGVRFELENGANPVIAQVGGTANAFGSSWGNDQPAPGQNIGEFFITDDGFLAGLAAVPLIVRFDNPLDSLSAMILDMDYDEVFSVEARDINDNPIFTTIIRAGDPGTGDGIATPFGFNLDGCEGAIYSLRFEGTRSTSGAFGLGMDNFVLCFSGIDIENNLDLTAKDEYCNGLGAIIISNASNVEYQYSIDGTNYITEEEFLNLPAGNYTIYIKDDADCSAEFELTVPLAEPISILSQLTQSTTCDFENGVVSITATGSDLEYSINGIDYSPDFVFENLPPGNITLYVKDQLGCLDSIDTVINPSSPLMIEAINTTIDRCEYAVGSIEIVMDPSSTYTYKINDEPISPINTFTDLPHGTYTIEVTDEIGCIADTMIIVPFSPAIFIEQTASSPSKCYEKNGTISYSYTGGTGIIDLLINNIPIQNPTSPITELDLGDYLITLTDEEGCVTELTVTVDQEICPIFHGNIFSPNGDGINDNFPLKTLLGYDANVLRYLIFDRWGNKVFDSRNFSIHDTEFWWDGKLNGRPAEQGVYVFTAEVLHPNSKIQLLSGDVTLIR